MHGPSGIFLGACDHLVARVPVPLPTSFFSSWRPQLYTCSFFPALCFWGSRATITAHLCHLPPFPSHSSTRSTAASSATTMTMTRSNLRTRAPSAWMRLSPWSRGRTGRGAAAAPRDPLTAAPLSMYVGDFVAVLRYVPGSLALCVWNRAHRGGGVTDGLRVDFGVACVYNKRTCMCGISTVWLGFTLLGWWTSPTVGSRFHDRAALCLLLKRQRLFACTLGALF